MQKGARKHNTKLMEPGTSSPLAKDPYEGDFPSSAELDALWSRHHAEWRDTAQVSSQWKEATEIDPQLLKYQITGAWWEILEKTNLTLLVTREYEHLVIALNAAGGQPSISYMCIPHPSGLVVDRNRGVVHLASTRNPNQVFSLRPVTGFMPRLDVETSHPPVSKPLVPVTSRFYPGCFYMHDLAMIGNELYANSVGQNAVVRFQEDGQVERVWWPRCIETENGPAFEQNYIQLNSIAAGPDLENSYFSASAEKISARRPGHKNFPVDKRGVIFSGATHEPIVRGLTRPHSARLHQGQIWVDNSGYGELGFVEDGKFTPVVKLPGWTRGLGFYNHLAFVGTSRVIPRFRQYAPGLQVERSLCGLYAIDTRNGQILGSLIWPYGNQIFAVDWVPNEFSSGFPFLANRSRVEEREKILFYTFSA